MNPVMGILLGGAVEQSMDGAWMIWANADRLKTHLQMYGFDNVRVRRSLHTQTVSEVELWKMCTETSPMGYTGGASEEQVQRARDLLRQLVEKQDGERFFACFMANVVVAERRQ